MVTLVDVENAAQKLVAVIPNVQTSTGAGKLYEAWLMLEIALTFRQHLHWRAMWCPWNYLYSKGMAAGSAGIIFRGGPGPIASATNTTPQPGFVVLREPSGHTAYEMHNSVQYLGASGVSHELDISIFDARRGLALRSNPAGGMPKGAPRAGLELKHYKGDVGIGIMRAFSLTALDLVLCSGFVTQIGHPSAMYVDRHANAYFGDLARTHWELVTSADSVGNGDRLGEFYGVSACVKLKFNPAFPIGDHPDVLSLVRRIAGHL